MMFLILWASLKHFNWIDVMSEECNGKYSRYLFEKVLHQQQRDSSPTLRFGSE